jgi:ribose/xylose/arabinose/galactoside ABC-type transport system permease subunit
VSQKKGTAHPILDWFLSEYLVLGLTVALFATLAPFTPGLATSASLVNILSYMLPLLVVAIGMTLVMIWGRN